jgi:hypothetical protein
LVMCTRQQRTPSLESGSSTHRMAGRSSELKKSGVHRLDVSVRTLHAACELPAADSTNNTNQTCPASGCPVLQQSAQDKPLWCRNFMVSIHQGRLCGRQPWSLLPCVAPWLVLFHSGCLSASPVHMCLACSVITATLDLTPSPVSSLRCPLSHFQDAHL